jgi:DNA-binding transcriptional MerR regulator
MGYAAVSIPEKIFFKIGEVCELVGVQAHVLRYWETEFPMLSPQKNRSGQRSYRRRDVEIALRIKELLYEDLYTIAGAIKKMQNELRDSSRLKIVHSENTKKESFLKEVKNPVDDVEEFDDRDLDIEEIEEFETASTEITELDEDRKEALVSLTQQLLELRELLKSKPI